MNNIETIIIVIVSVLIGGVTTYYFSKKTEDYKFLQAQKQKAEAVAKLFSRWIKYRGKERDYLNQDELIDYYEGLNQMSFEVSFCIKDYKLLSDIMLLLQNAPDAKNFRVIIGEMRKLILCIQKDNFDPQNITIWPNEEIASNLFNKTKK
ncbi:MAG: hypothetical protein WCW54_02280 [Candidatus Paceibacterota bacterium]